MALILVALASARFAAVDDNLVVIRNVTVVDVVAGRLIPNRTVTIRGEEIRSVAETGALSVPRGTRVVDGSGKFLIPGLWDMHTHFTHDPSSLDLFIAHGVTGVRDMGSIAIRRVGERIQYLPREKALSTILKAREDVRKGKRLGPRIYTTGMIVTGPNPRNPNAPGPPHQIVVRTPKEARATVRALSEKGVDAIKVHARLSRECFLAIADEAKKRGKPVVGHVPLAINPIEASNAGQKSIEHMTGVWEYAHIGMPADSEDYDPKRLRDEIAVFRNNGTYHVPTLVNYEAPALAFEFFQNPKSQAFLDYAAPDLALRWMTEYSRANFNAEIAKGFRDSVSTLQEISLRMLSGGVPIMAGTDAGGLFTVPGVSLHRELELLQEGGFTPLQCLRAATIRPAEFLGLAAGAGSVAKGKAADLVLLRSNPLQDVKAVRDIEAVFVRGRYLDRRKLHALLQAVKTKASSSRRLLRDGKWGD